MPGKRSTGTPILVRYADDLVVCCSLPAAGRAGQGAAGGLARAPRVWSSTRTRRASSHLDEGFDFLGFHLRRYRRRRRPAKLLIKPSPDAVRRIRNRLADEVRSLRGSNAMAVIARLNPIIRGWAAYYRGVVSSRVFAALDNHVWWLTYRWARHSHPNKPKKWIARRYFGRFNKFRNDQWVFGARDHVVNDRGDVAYLVKFSWTNIVRHQLVAGRASPDDPDLIDYWAARRRKVKPPLDSYNLRLLAKQDGRCPLCGDHLLVAGPAPAVPTRVGTMVAERRPQGNRRRLPHPSRARRRDRTGTEHAWCTPPATAASGCDNAGTRRHRHPRRPRGLLEPRCGESPLARF